jgi:hypothetical protein
MSAKKLSPEQLQKLAQIKQELAELKQRSNERLAYFESLSANKLYC